MGGAVRVGAIGVLRVCNAPQLAVFGLVLNLAVLLLDGDGLDLAVSGHGVGLPLLEVLRGGLLVMRCARGGAAATANPYDEKRSEENWKQAVMESAHVNPQMSPTRSLAK